VFPELLVCSVVISAHGGFLKGAVHAFDLAVGPWVIWLGETMFDTMLPANALEAVQPVSRCRPRSMLRHIAELDTIIGQNGVDLVGAAAIRASRKAAEVLTLAASYSWAKANFEVRSIATNRCNLPCSVRTSAISMWK